MKKEKVLIIFTRYKQYGGEETVINNELLYLNKKYDIKYLEFTNNNLFSLMFSSFNLVVFFKIVFSIFTFKPQKIYINNLWFGGSNAVFYASFVFRNLDIYYKVHNYRFSCSKGTHFLDGNICELCNSNEKSYSYKYKCYRDSLVQTFLINIFSRIQIHALKNKKIRKIYTLNKLQKEKLIDSGISSERIDISKNILNINTKDLPDHKRISNTFCFIGRLESEKGILDLLNVWGKLDTENFKLLIVGDGEWLMWLSDLQKNLKIYQFLGKLIMMKCSKF